MLKYVQVREGRLWVLQWRVLSMLHLLNMNKSTVMFCKRTVRNGMLFVQMSISLMVIHMKEWTCWLVVFRVRRFLLQESN